MLQYMTTKDAADKWEISQRRVNTLCAENRISDAAMLGNMWIIPINANKPDDARMSRNFDDKSKMHPFVKWAGGKNQHLKILTENLPEGFGKNIRKYAEPFVGGGALLFEILSKYKLDAVYINDNNKELINAFNIIKFNCKELIKNLDEIENEYLKLYDEERQNYFYIKRVEFNWLELNEYNQIKKAALFIFLNKTCFNGLYRVNKHGKFNVPVGKYKNPLICDSENLFKISKALQNVEINCLDYHDCYKFADDQTLIYFDPPYRPLNKTSSFTSYTENVFSDKNQIELAEFYKKLSEKGVKLLLSNSDPKNFNKEDNFFDNLYYEFNIKRINAVRMINSAADKRGHITELLIKNY